MDTSVGIAAGENSYQMLDMFGTLLGLVIVVMVIGIIFAILYYVGAWRTYSKLGLDGWAALIPVYNVWVLAEELVEEKLAIAATTVSGATLALEILYNLTGNGSAPILCGLLLAGFVMDCIIKNALANAFGRGAGFTIGLIMLPSIFFMILGCGNNQAE